MIKTVSDQICTSTHLIKREPEVSNPTSGFEMFNSGGVELEIAELLHSLVRTWKPEIILETGTHLGISSLYMALALEANKKGHLVTLEVIPELLQKAQLLWKQFGMSGRITGLLKPSLEAEIAGPIDFLFLDSEPQFRFDEFIKFFPLVSPGGLIVIHDLHPSLGHHGQTYHGVFDWPYGYWKSKLASYIDNFEVQLIHPPNPRGCTIFQKTIPSWEAISWLHLNFDPEE